MLVFLLLALHSSVYQSSTVTVPAPAAFVHASAFLMQQTSKMMPRPGDELHAYALNMSASTMALPSADERPMFYVSIYAAITLGTAISGLIVGIIEYAGAYRASKILFKRLLVSVVRAPFR